MLENGDFYKFNKNEEQIFFACKHPFAVKVNKMNIINLTENKKLETLKVDCQ